MWHLIILVRNLANYLFRCTYSHPLNGFIFRYHSKQNVCPWIDQIRTISYLCCSYCWLRTCVTYTCVRINLGLFKSYLWLSKVIANDLWEKTLYIYNVFFHWLRTCWGPSELVYRCRVIKTVFAKYTRLPDVSIFQNVRHFASSSFRNLYGALQV